MTPVAMSSTPRLCQNEHRGFAISKCAPFFILGSVNYVGAESSGAMRLPALKTCELVSDILAI